jgi:hypothetical protein
MNTDLQTYGSIAKDLTLCHWSPERKKKMSEMKKYFERMNNGWTLPNLAKRFWPLNSRNQENYKQDKAKEILTKINNSQTSET